MFRTPCLICGSEVLTREKSCEKVTEEGNKTSTSTGSGAVNSERELRREKQERNRDLFRSLLRRFQVELNWSTLMITKRKKNWKDVEFVPSFCDICKEQLETICQLEKQIGELDEMLQRGTELVKGKMKERERFFKDEKIYERNDKYLRIRRKILGACVVDNSSKLGINAGETKKDLQDSSMLTSVRRSTRTPKPIIYTEDQRLNCELSSGDSQMCAADDNGEGIALQAEYIFKEEPDLADFDPVDELCDEWDMNYSPTRSPLSVSPHSTESTYSSNFDSGIPQYSKRAKRSSVPNSKSKRINARDDSEQIIVSPTLEVNIATTPMTVLPNQRDNFAIKHDRGSRGSYKKNAKVHVDPITGYWQYLQVKFEKLAEDKYQCIDCQEIVNNESTIKKHTMRSHTDNYVCPICGQHKACNSDLKKHIREVHEGVTRKNLKKNLECPICGKPFGHKTHMQNHKLTHYNEQDKQDAIAKGAIIPGRVRHHQCGICGVIFNNITWLKRHEKIKHPRTEEDRHETQRICPECGKSFSVAYFKQHKERYHSGLDDTAIKPFQCSVCDKRFYNHHCLTEHKRTHTGERPFKCLLCDKYFTSNRRLKLHNMQHHESKKPFACTSCSAAFVTSYKLKRHVATVHEGKNQKNWNVNLHGTEMKEIL